MKFPNWFKVAWWFVLTSLIFGFLYFRIPDLVAGRSSAFDLVALVIGFGLLLAPIFQEVSLLGVTLKQQIDELKKEVTTQLSELKNEINSTIDVQTQFNPQIHFPLPPPDSSLPELEKRVNEAVDRAIERYGLSKPAETSKDFGISDDTHYLFAVRFALEKELRRILVQRGILDSNRRLVATMRLTRDLVVAGIIEPNFEHAIREVFSICSSAIHGESVSEAKVEFVKDVAPGLLAVLRGIA